MNSYLLCVIVWCAGRVAVSSEKAKREEKLTDWSARFTQSVVETDTTTFKIVLAVSTSKKEFRQLLIRADCEVGVKNDRFNPCPGENVNLNTSRHHTMHNDTRLWTLHKPTLNFKGVEMQEITATRKESPDLISVESGFIKCCLTQIDTPTFDIVEAAFVANLSPNVPLEWSSKATDFETDIELSIYRKQRPSTECDASREHNRWWPFLCMVYDNSPYLGHFYARSPPLLNTLPAFNANHQTKQPQFTKQLLRWEYSHGSPIKTSVDYSTFTYLTLPDAALNGKCVEASPVRFLVPRKSRCNFAVTQTTCNDLNSLISVRSYPNKRDNFRIFAGNDVYEVLNVTYVYVCAPNALCQPNEIDLSFDSQSKVCKNVVREVTFAFTWRGSRLTSLVVAVIFDTVKLNKSLYMPLLYVVTFVRDNQMTKTLDRPRNLGYAMNDVLLTATGDFNRSQFDIGHNSSLHFPLADGDGYCTNDGIIKFGMDLNGGCKLRVNNCSNFREEVSSWLCANLLPSEYVSKTRNPRLDNSDDFIPIIRDELCVWKSNETCNVTTLTVSVKVIYTSSSHLGLTQFYTIQGLQIKTNAECWKCVTVSVTLQVTVEFHKLVNETSNVKRFWLKQSGLACSQDSCWSDLIFPFTRTDPEPIRLLGEHWTSTTRSALSLLMSFAVIVIVVVLKANVDDG